MRGIHARTCRHQKFSIDLHDRARTTFPEALALAVRRAPARGRQTVRRHVGPWFPKGVWFVQDVRAAAEVTS